MKKRLIGWWRSIRGSYWFVPALMTVSAVGFAYLMPFLDGFIEGPGEDVPGWIYGGGARGARSLLSTIAGSMITVASLTFSITLVALSSAAHQYGPRLLNNFMRDTGYQVVLGTFVATFVYCVLVLRQIQDVEGDLTLPRLAVSFAVVLAIAALALLIYFFHHVASSLRADELIARIGDELVAAVDRSLKDGKEVSDGEEPEPDDAGRFPDEPLAVESPGSGYIQSIDLPLLLKLAGDKDLILRLRHRAGAFVLEGSTLIEVWPPERVDQEVQDKLGGAFGFGTTSFLPGDIESLLSELREIALRALSPSLNTPNTAISCIDQLARGLRRMAEAEKRAKESGRHPLRAHYVEHRLRLLAARLGLIEMVDLAFDQVRHHAADLPYVSLRLLEALVSLASKLDEPKARAAVVRQIDMIVRAAQNWPEPWYQDRVSSLRAALLQSDQVGGGRRLP
jgi:uncharacterized membrane protein